MALRFDFVPASWTLSQRFFPVRSLRSREGGSFKIDDQNVKVAVVVEISKRAATAPECGLNDSRSCFVAEFLKGSVAKIAKEDAWCLIGIIGEGAFSTSG